MPSSNDLIKYVTVEFLRYMDQPKVKRKKEKESILTKMFGLVPIAVKMVWNQYRRKKA